MKAIIIYDDCALEAKAYTMLERAARRADADPRQLQWHTPPWRGGPAAAIPKLSRLARRQRRTFYCNHDSKRS